LSSRRTSSPAISAASRVARRCSLSKWAGTVMTASCTLSPKKVSAASRSSRRIIALSSGGDRATPRASTQASPLGAGTTLYGSEAASVWTSA